MKIKNLVKKVIVCCFVVLSLTMIAGCEQQETNEKSTTNIQMNDEVKSIEKEKLISLPEDIGNSESLIMFNQTNLGKPLLYTIGQDKQGYFYKKYTYEGNEWISEQAEFQDACYKHNKEMIVQRVFNHEDFLYLITAVVIDPEKNDYDLFLYRYNIKKERK